MRSATVTEPPPRCYRWDGDTLVLNILGSGGARRDRIGEVVGDRLKVSVKAAPEAGRATKYMVKFLAGEFGVSPAAVRVVYGETSRKKQLRIRSPVHLPAGIAREQD